MKVAFGVALALSATAQAEVPAGYAFDRPPLLARQIAWGHLHGVRLLAQACAGRDAAATTAYADWLDRQQQPIMALARELSQHYFGIKDAPLAAIDAALNLKPALETPAETLADACATLPQALASGRHDVDRLIDDRP